METFHHPSTLITPYSNVHALIPAEHTQKPHLKIMKTAVGLPETARVGIKNHD